METSAVQAASPVPSAGDVASVLTRAVRAVYSRWFALRIAAEQAGREGAALADELLADSLVLMLAARTPTQDDYLELMDDAFERLETSVEDGSIEYVARLLARMRNDAARGDLAVARQQIEKGEGNAPWNSAAVANAARSAREDEGVLADEDPAPYALNNNTDGDGMEVETPQNIKQQGPTIDEDGFEVVERKKNYRPRP